MPSTVTATSVLAQLIRIEPSFVVVVFVPAAAAICSASSPDSRRPNASRQAPLTASATNAAASCFILVFMIWSSQEKRHDARGVSRASAATELSLGLELVKMAL